MDEATRLVVVWTSGDREVALKCAFMYTINSKLHGWFADVCLVIWGPSAKLLSEDAELQDYVRRMAQVGVTIEACKACADQYGVSEQLAALGCDVKYMGEPLTDYLQAGRKVLTF